jgi:hypothetical protein
MDHLDGSVTAPAPLPPGALPAAVRAIIEAATDFGHGDGPEVIVCGRAEALARAALSAIVDPVDLADQLTVIIADLDGYIERRAAEMAAPKIAEAERSIEFAGHRVSDLQQEFERERDAMKQRLLRSAEHLAVAKAESRQNAEIAAAAIDRAKELERQLAEVTSDGS